MEVLTPKRRTPSLLYSSPFLFFFCAFSIGAFRVFFEVISALIVPSCFRFAPLSLAVASRKPSTDWKTKIVKGGGTGRSQTRQFGRGPAIPIFSESGHRPACAQIVNFTRLGCKTTPPFVFSEKL